ncbi:MAG: DNA mismatch repair endonuclease MutL [Calditrichaeota bacterium]|nr:DNA mismatch repair endonuclease MutL [Calditrichota bacterium]
MPIIKVLPTHIANKIAAGEVVDRPASVVKELVENAIDARADHISVIIAKAGKELIQVIDNGVGMEAEDAELAFKRHATSKIAQLEDLERILTLGFRGEALPSIASVSRLELKTCARGSQLGSLFAINGGQIVTREKIAFKPGTSIAVKNLFFNTPARRNFLRADSTEFNHILKTLRCFFLAYPEVHFVLVHNGEELYNLPAQPLDERIGQVFGEKNYQGLVYFREELNDIVLEGYVCTPDQTRGNTANQYIFLNRRVIVNRQLSHAIFQGYGNLIERSRYPQYIINLHVPPQMVDVNVHPTKMEVRFANERAIYHLFLSAVRKAVQSRHIVPGFTLDPGAEAQQEIRQHFQQFRPGTEAPPTPVQPFKTGGASSSAGMPAQDRPFQPSRPVGAPEKSPASPGQGSFTYEPLPSRPTTPATPKPPDARTTANLWQVHNRYIFSQINSGLVIIDQYAAHQRILYEQILHALNEQKKAPSQQLLFPQTVELALEDYLIFEDIKSWLDQIGFGITAFSGRTVLIEAIPAEVKVGNEAKILSDIIDYYRENEGVKQPPQEKIAAAFASKNALKSGEKLTPEAMTALVDQLFRTREPYFTPGGKPVIVTLELDELDRKFKRG